MKYRVMAQVDDFNHGRPWCTSGWCESFIHALWHKQIVQDASARSYVMNSEHLWIEDEQGRKVDVRTFRGDAPLKYRVRRHPSFGFPSAVSGWYDSWEDAERRVHRLHRKFPKQLYWISAM